MSTGKLLRLADCARITGHRVSTWRAWILNGKINYFKIGGSIRISEADLEEFINAAHVGARGEQQAEAR